MARFIWLHAFFICFVIPLLAQESPSPPETSGRPTLTAPPELIPRSHEEREQRFRDLHHMILDVLVTDASGNPISGLIQQNFTLLDNRQPQRLISFREVKGDSGIAPVHVILLLDDVNTTSRRTDYELKEIGKYLGKNQGHLIFPTSIAVLTGSGIEVSQTSQVGSTLLDEARNLIRKTQPPYDCGNDNRVSSLPVSGHGNTNIGLSIEKTNDGDCLNQKFELSLSSLGTLANRLKDTPGRDVVIWIGPGWPLLSGPEFLPDTSAIRQNLFDHLVELSNSFREAQITLDAASSPDLFRTTEWSVALKSSLREVETEKQVSASSLSVNALARHSGGRIMESGRDIAGFVAACVADAKTYYVLSFNFAPASEPDEFHSLKVEVNRVGARVRTNTEYYSEP